jgi:hypothetical protein
VEVKELSRYNDIKEKRKLVHHVFKAFGIEWILRLYVILNVENTIPRDQFISIYLSHNRQTTQIP